MTNHYTTLTRSVHLRTRVCVSQLILHSPSAHQVFCAVVGEKFSVDIENHAIDSTLDQFYFLYLLSLLDNFFLLYSWFTCSSLLHLYCDLVSFLSCDFRKVFRVYAKMRSQGTASIRS